MKINFKQCNGSNYRGGRAAPILWLVLHYTANNGDTAKNNADYFAGNANLRASAHYFVDEESIWQSVRDCDTAWHCGAEAGGRYYNSCRNCNSIGIEMCSDKVNGQFTITEATMKNAAELTRALMNKYNIPVSRVCRHYDVTHKDCPEPWVRNPKLWDKFKAMLTEKEVEDMTEAQTRKIAQEEIKNNTKVYNTIDECPEWARNTVQRLLNKGFMQGENGKLNLTYDLLRVLVINDRAHLYG